MKLIVAHQILISAAIALAAIFGARGFSRFWQKGDPFEVVIGAGAMAIAVALFFYLKTVRAKAAAEGKKKP